MTHNRNLAIHHSIVSLLLILLFVGCGGGTSGTDGGQTVRILGSLVNQNSSPLPAATVTVLDSGESTQTDASGAFALETPSTPSLTVEVVTGQLRFQSTIGDLDPNSPEITLTIQIDTERGTISIENVSIKPNPTPSAPPASAPASPAPTPAPSTKSPSTILGTIINKQDLPVAGVTVRLLGSNVSTTTDSTGAFRIESVVRDSQVRLRISTGSNSGTVTIGGLPSEPFTLTVTLRFGSNPTRNGSRLTVTVETRSVERRS